MEQISDVIIRYLDQTQLPLRKFAQALTESLRNDELSHTAVMRWRDGISEPETDFLATCLVTYAAPDWRFHFALDCLQAKRPDLWTPGDGGIWRVFRRIEKEL